MICMSIPTLNDVFTAGHETCDMVWKPERAHGLWGAMRHTICMMNENKNKIERILFL